MSDLLRTFVLVLAQGPEPSMPMGAFAHFGIEVSSRDEVDRLASAAKVAGVLAAGPKQSGPLYWAYLRDPDGHNVEISYGGESIDDVVRAARSR
jgi:hypothetical protein